MDKMKIGYQGIEGSNSEAVAKLMAVKLKMKNVEYIPLISSKSVIGELKRGNIDYGVVAVKNTLGGTVKETFEAIKNEFLELVTTEILQIHHSLFKRKDVEMTNIKSIASHIQALKQTKENRKRLFPDCEEVEMEDTALAAKYLADGTISEETAVLCRKETGIDYGLELIYENLEDNSENFTEFRMFKLSDLDYSNTEEPTLIEKLKYQIVNESGLGYISKVLMVFAIFISFYLAEFFKWSSWDTAMFVGGYLSVLFLFITSDNIRQKFRYQSIVGFWKYYSLSESEETNMDDQKFDVPRLVKIEEIDGELVFSGFICDMENIPLFESTKVLVSALGKCRGQLVYWYTNPSELHRGYSVNGLVELNWVTKHPAAKINKMSGYYMGKATKDRGGIQYLRITEEEYLAHKNSDFL